jgi:hypothetical protein
MNVRHRSALMHGREDYAICASRDSILLKESRFVTVAKLSSTPWIAQQWSVPVLAQISKLTAVGKQPVSLAAGVRYWAVSPSSGPHGFGGLVSISFMK